MTCPPLPGKGERSCGLTQKRKWVFLGIAALILAAACLWYARPLTVEELCPWLELERCRGVYIDYSTYDDKGLENRITLTAEEELAPLLELVQGRKFSRTPFGRLSAGTRTHRLSDGDFKWSIDLSFQDVSLPDGSSGSGYMLHFNNFFGELELGFEGEYWPVRTADQERWLEDVMGYILAVESQNDSIL